MCHCSINSVATSAEALEGAKADACLARVPGEGELDLMALDFGHLTPKGSSYLGRALWKPYSRLGHVDEYLLPPP